MTGYTYRGNRGTASDAEVKARVAAAQAQARSERPAPQPLAAVPALKGAVKVAAFPSRSPYPFREIAGDGGVWKLDPTAFNGRQGPPKPESVRSAAWTWAKQEGMTSKVVIDGGMVYVQFTRKAAS